MVHVRTAIFRVKTNPNASASEIRIRRLTYILFRRWYMIKKFLTRHILYQMTAVTEAQEALEANGHGIFTQVEKKLKLNENHLSLSSLTKLNINTTSYLILLALALLSEIIKTTTKYTRTAKKKKKKKKKKKNR